MFQVALGDAEGVQVHLSWNYALFYSLPIGILGAPHLGMPFPGREPDFLFYTQHRLPEALQGGLSTEVGSVSITQSFSKGVSAFFSLQPLPWVFQYVLRE